MMIRENPHRLSREHYQGRVTVSFTACVQSFNKPFVEPSIVAEFIRQRTAATEKNRCVVPIFCFMPDHLHVMMHGDRDDADLWRAMVSFKQSSGFWFGQNRCEFEWQKDFHDHIIKNAVERAVRVRYIADNPVRRKMAVVWSDYPYTGAIGMDLAQVMADLAFG